MKAHKRCAIRLNRRCKWTTRESVAAELGEGAGAGPAGEGVPMPPMPHQWAEGNLPMAARCRVCAKTAGSILRLQDWRCLWCQVLDWAAIGALSEQ